MLVIYQIMIIFNFFYNPSDSEDNQIHFKYHKVNERDFKYTEL